MIIVGAGMAGLLAANMLAHQRPVIYERQQHLPNNHSAVLRFKTSMVGDVLNIPFRKVTMMKAVAPHRNPIADALSYSAKNTGELRSDRSITQGTVTDERWIAPADLIPRMAARCTIELNHKHRFTRPNEWAPVISTVPMPALMQALDYPHHPPVFRSVPGTNIKARIHDCDAFISLLVPDPALPFSRVSITADELTIECPATAQYQVDEPFDRAKAVLAQACMLLGLKLEQTHSMTLHRQQYAKITPIDEETRKAFLFWATDNFGIFSLGRFATWRPSVQLDDLVQDVRLIARWSEQGNRYSVARHR